MTSSDDTTPAPGGQGDSFEEEATHSISGQVDALRELVEGDDGSSGDEPDTPGPDTTTGSESSDTGDDRFGGAASAWQSHGGDAPSRGPQVAGDGMSESPSAGPDHQTGPDGEPIDSDVSDGGESGQDSGSMS